MPKARTTTATKNIQAVVGSDEAEVKRVAGELAANLTPPGAGDFGLEIIDGAADNAEQAGARIRSTIEALQTLPFLGAENWSGSRTRVFSAIPLPAAQPLCKTNSKN